MQQYNIANSPIWEDDRFIMFCSRHGTNVTKDVFSTSAQVCFKWTHTEMKIEIFLVTTHVYIRFFQCYTCILVSWIIIKYDTNVFTIQTHIRYELV